MVKYTTFYKQDMGEMVEHWLQDQLRDNIVGNLTVAK